MNGELILMNMKCGLKKNNSIYVWRIVFTILIMVMHFNNMYSEVYKNPYVTSGWYIAVEFFFIVSGFLLMVRVDDRKSIGETAIQYTISRYKKLYPEYLFALLVSWGVTSYLTKHGLKLSILTLLGNWEELFLLQCIGLNRFPFMSNVTWYISVMIIAGFIIYYFVTNHRKIYTQFLLLMSIVVIYSYLYRNNGGLDYWIETENLWLNEGVFRGIMDMNIGVAIYSIYKQAEKIKWSRVSKYIFLVLEMVCYGFVIIMSIRHGGEYDFVLLAILAVAILLSFMNDFFEKFHTSKGLKYVNELTYAMYLNHNLWNGYILPRFWSTSEWHLRWVVLYVVFVFFYSVVTHWLVLKCARGIKYAGKRLFLQNESESFQY